MALGVAVALDCRLGTSLGSLTGVADRLFLAFVLLAVTVEDLIAALPRVIAIAADLASADLRFS